MDEFADLYCTLWTNSLRNRGDFDDATLAGRYNISMQFNRSPITIVAESDGKPIALCCVGLFDEGKPRTNEHWHAIYIVAESDGKPIALCCVGLFDEGKPRTNEHWHAIYEDLLAQATERLEQGGDERLAGCLFGDTREKATADRFAATGNEFAQAQINLLIIRPELPGKGLGGELIRRARAAVRDAGRTKFFLMTDSESDWHFYDHLGMTRIAASGTPAAPSSSS